MGDYYTKEEDGKTVVYERDGILDTKVGELKENFDGSKSLDENFFDGLIKGALSPVEGFVEGLTGHEVSKDHDVSIGRQNYLGESGGEVDGVSGKFLRPDGLTGESNFIPNKQTKVDDHSNNYSRRSSAYETDYTPATQNNQVSSVNASDRDYERAVEVLRNKMQSVLSPEACKYLEQRGKFSPKALRQALGECSKQELMEGVNSLDAEGMVNEAKSSLVGKVVTTVGIIGLAAIVIGALAGKGSK